MVIILGTALVISIMVIMYLLRKNDELKRILANSKNEMKRGRREIP